MVSGRSVFRRIAGFLTDGNSAEVSPEFRAAVEAGVKGEKVLRCLKLAKIFNKNASSFSGETFFRAAAVLTDRRLILLRDSSEYNEIKSFRLHSVSGCAVRSDGGKPALVVGFPDGSESRLVFSGGHPEAEAFANMLALTREDAPQSAAGGGFCGQCGKGARSGAKFCTACGAPLDFTASENTMDNG